MDPDTANIVAVASAITAGLSVIFAIYSHFRTHRVAKLTFEVSQLSDFDVPPDFLDDLPGAPVALTITSRGNKGTENIVLNLKTTSDIEKFNVNREGLDISLEGQSLGLNVEKTKPLPTSETFFTLFRESLAGSNREY